MTSIRDTAVLEQSLLKTLGPLLGVPDTTLYRADEAHNLVRVMHYHRSMVIEDNGVTHMVERVEEFSNALDVPPETSALLKNVRLLTRPSARRIGNEVVTAYPLMGGDEICGYFVFQRDREASSNEDAIIRGVLEVFSNYYALLDASQRDRLTGLLNRQALEVNFDRIWALLSRSQTMRFEDDGEGDGEGRRKAIPGQYWLAMFDIDHFKRVNDTFGHIIGDEVLLLVSRLMTVSFRNSDLLYRWGGEEFVAILSAENDQIARNIFERVRLAIEAHVFPQVGHVTISCGYSHADPGILPQEVLSRADRALYQAKNDGRNRVYSFEELVSRGVFPDFTSYGDAELF